MALTSELLQGNSVTAGLTAEQIQAIVTMSVNDENSVIAAKTGEIYGALDNDILTVSGIAKNGTEKTYDYAKRVIGEMKSQAGNATELGKQIAELTKEKARLEKVISDGGADAETKKQLNQAKADLAAVQKSYADVKAELDTAKTQHEKDLFNLKLDSEIEKSNGSFKFKANLPESVTSVLLNNAKEKIKGMNPEFIDDGKGGKVLAFKDANGAILRNPETNLNIYTATELIAKELKAMDVLETGKGGKGAGSGAGGNGGNGGGSDLDISGARTQVEAEQIISKALLAQGLIKGSEDYQTAFDKAWKDNNIKALPYK